MLLANLLNPKTILHISEKMDKVQIYRLLLQRICQKTELHLCEEKLLTMTLKRDNESSTAYPSGIAIPNIRVEDFHDTVVGMAFLEEAIDFDGVPIRWVALVITDISSSNIYLNLVATLLKLSKDQELLNKLLNKEDGAAVVQLLKKMQIKLKKDLTIADIMVTDPVYIQSNASLRDLGDLLNKSNHSFLPVVDENKHFLGSVNVLHLLKVGVPDYLMMLDNLSFLSSFEPLEHLFEQQDTLDVGEIMINRVYHLRPDTSIPEAVFEMIQNKQRFFPVVDDNGFLVGVVTAMDIFRKIMKA